MAIKKLPANLRVRNGNLHYRFVANGHEYSRDTGLAASERNVAKALRALTEARELVESGQAHLLKLTAKVFSDAADEFLAWAASEHADHPATARRLRTSFASLRLFFGSTPVHTITAGDVERYKAWRRTEHHIAEITLRHDLHALSPFFGFARKSNWCRYNPVEDVSIPSDKDAVRMHILSAEEEARYFQAAERWPILHDVGRIILNQGMRPVEVMGLPKARVVAADCAGSYAIRFAIAIVQGKTRAARRTLEMTPEVQSIITRRYVGDSVWLFPAVRNEALYISASTLAKWHDKALAACGLSFVLYDLRHTCATRWAERGMPVPTIAYLLGHSKLQMVERYVHVRAESAAQAMRQYGEAAVEPQRKGAVQ